MIRANTQKNYSPTKLSQQLKNRIFGQDTIIDDVIETLSVSLAGLGDEEKPMASFLFTGPTGVGKTELAKELAKCLGMHVERFDMSEYSDSHSARNLTGGSAGLVGYEEGGLLTNAILKNPKCILLLDEIEKADEKVYNSFLQVLDYGSLTDTKGNKADFSQTIIIMTSNLGANEKPGIGFGNNKDVHKFEAMSNFLTPEFRNRIDKVLDFKPLTRDVVVQVSEKFIGDFIEKLKKKQLTLEISKEAKHKLTDMGYNYEMGARSIYRAINKEFKSTIAIAMLNNDIERGSFINIDLIEKEFVFKFSRQVMQQHDVSGTQGRFVFETAQEAQQYAKENIGTTITRSPDGYGYVISS